MKIEWFFIYENKYKMKISRRKFLNNTFVPITGLSLFPYRLLDQITKIKETKSEPDKIKVSINSELINQGDIKSLGLNKISSQHFLLYNAEKEIFKYSHHPQIAVFKNKLYVMWSNGIEHEDWNAQRVLWTYTKNGKNWEAPNVLIEDPDGKEGIRFAVASGFHEYENKLIAYYTSTVHKKTESDVYAIEINRNNKSNISFKIVENTHVIEGPRKIPTGRLLMGGMYPNRNPRILYTDSPDGLSGWNDSIIPPMSDKIKGAFPEPNWFVRKDGLIVLLLRATENDPWLYFSISRDNGESWSVPERSNIPSATSRMSVGNLPDGRAFCIWNPSQHTDLSHKGRSPLVIALSTDTITFERAYVIRDEPTNFQFSGISKRSGWQYPSAVVWENNLWITYSENKEDIMVSRISLSDLN